MNTTEHKIVSITQWEIPSFRESLETEGWKVSGYSDFVSIGRTTVPTKVELKRYKADEPETIKVNIMT